ncbi:MAG: GatB/YqeY domain-containing protein [Thermoanaerobaculia bacterium]
MPMPHENIQSEIKEALKAGDKERVSTLRLLLTAIKNEQIRAGAEVDEAGFLQLVRKAIKQRKDSAEQYRSGDREELAAKEEREAEILSAYLPPQADEDELRGAIAALVDEQELSGPAAIGVIMKTMMAKYAGRADGGTINKIAREVLGT